MSCNVNPAIIYVYIIYICKIDNYAIGDFLGSNRPLFCEYY